MTSVYLHWGLFAAAYSVGNKEQKLMQAIALGKKSYLEFHKDPFWDLYFLTFSCVTSSLF